MRNSSTKHPPYIHAILTNKISLVRHTISTKLEIIKSLSVKSSGTLLDCAVGDGQITAQVISSNQFTRVVLVDISEKMLEIAKDNCQVSIARELNLETTHSDIYEFLESSESDSYDLIICSGLIAHISDALKLFKLLHKALSPNGRIILQSTLLDSPITAIVKTLTEKDYYAKNGYMINYYKHKDIIQLCDQANLEIDSWQRFSMGLQFLDNKLPPKLNHFLENILGSIAKFSGTEAIYLLKAIKQCS